MCQTKPRRDNSLETRLWMGRQGHLWELGEQRGSGCTARARAEGDDAQTMGVSGGKRAGTVQTSCSWQEKDKERSLARRNPRITRNFSHEDMAVLHRNVLTL